MSAGPDVPAGSSAPLDRSVEGLARFTQRWWAVGLFLLLGLAFTCWPPYSNSPPIRADGLGYHAWTRAILDGNVSFCPYVELTTVAALEPPSALGRCGNKYPPGLALLRFPVMAPFTAVNHGQLRSPAEDRVDQLLSVAAGGVSMVAVIVAARLLRVSWGIANFAAAAVMFGSNEFHYATYDSSFSHIYSAAVLGVLVILVTRAAARGAPLGWTGSVVAGLAAGLLVDIRLLLVVPLALLAGLLVLAAVRSGVALRDLLHRHVRTVMAVGVGVCAAVAQQMLYNRYITGRWTLSSYAGEDFVWSQGKQLHVLFSISNGAIPWSPVIGIGIVVALAVRAHLVAWSAIVATAALAVIYGAWHSWDLAGGFGHRGFVDLAPLYGLAAAVGLARLARPWRRLAGALCVVAVVMTMGLMRAYWTGEIPYYSATHAQYLRYSVGTESLIAHYAKAWFG